MRPIRELILVILLGCGVASAQTGPVVRFAGPLNPGRLPVLL